MLLIVALETRGAAPSAGSQEEHQVLVRKQKQDKALGLG